MRVTTSFLRGEVVASNHEWKKSFPPWKQQEGNQKQNFKKGGFRNQSRPERKQDRFTLLTKTPKEIFALDKGKFKAPPPMTTPVEKRNHAKFYEFHGEVGKNIEECMHLKKQIEEMLKARKLSHLIKELKQNNGKEQPKAVKKGETFEKDKALAILMVQSWERVARKSSELGSELTLLAGSELKSSELDTSELKTSEYKFLKIFILASYEQELCQFNFLLASCQLSSIELHIASYSSDTRPPMLDRTDFASWQQRILLYYRGTEGALHLGPERPRVYSDLSPEDKERYNADIRATNILLQGLPNDIYTLINHYTDAKDIWDNVKMLLEGSELTKEDRESQLYDDFEHFHQNKGETIHDYHVWFAKLINDMQNIKMTMSRMQLNSKFVNNMLPEWGRFVTAVKLNRGLRDSNYDQLYAYLKQHKAHANENKMMLDRFT
ncbi:hypothetical protein Tco_0024047 [Tanacetum coccineum]